MDKTRYFHGGYPFLKPGMYVLPPQDTGAVSIQDVGPNELRACARAVHRRDRVYLATDSMIALLFAAMHPSGFGQVYEVEPVGSVEQDPDFTGPSGMSVSAVKAKVVSIVRFTKQQRADMIFGLAEIGQGP
jgi:hypothetical protein